ncbi:unannotated protein [freshwater metagenome]|uniref:Unannotated protein n=1 Tax=freshwater metagenome TaxID=449393 RepID=A0A6J7VHD5_9ZZZZ
MKIHFLFDPVWSAFSTGLFEMTAQCAGTVAEIAKVAFKSGWSKHANVRRASATSC